MRKISVIARACAIFGVHTIYVYKEVGNAIISKNGKKSNRGRYSRHHHGSNNSGSGKSDADLLVMTLRYLETPQFLRKQLFAQNSYLKFAGVMLPLQIPSHTTSKTLSDGQVREGVIVTSRGRGRYIDVGADRILPYMGNAEPGRRITIQINKTAPDVTYTVIRREQIDSYWGYLVKHRASLPLLLAEWNKSKGQTIITSRKGKPVLGRNEPSHQNDSKHVRSSSFYGVHKSRIFRDSSDVLVVFGSPDRGVQEILGGSIASMSNARVLNFFPNQQTATVRLDEAVMGVLAMINAEMQSLAAP